jgi:hypothetical protein
MQLMKFCVTEKKKYGKSTAFCSRHSVELQRYSSRYCCAVDYASKYCKSTAFCSRHSVEVQRYSSRYCCAVDYANKYCKSTAFLQ